MSSAPPTADIPRHLADKLRGLRQSLVGWLIVDGLAAVLLTVAGVVLVDFAVDWLFRMDKAQRLVCLVLMAAAIGYVLYRRLLKPLARPMSDDMLALQVEASHRELDQALIGALQLARIEPQAEHLGVSPHLMRATIERGSQAAERIDFSDVLQRDRLWRNVLVCLLVVGGFLAAAVARGSDLWTWFDRNVLLGDSKWPQDTHLRIVAPKIERDAQGQWYLALPRGDDLKLEVEVESGIVPKSVNVQTWSAKASHTTQPMSSRDESQAGATIAADAQDKPRFEFTFKNVLDDFAFRAQGGDGDTPAVEVRLVDRPAVNSLQLEVVPPPYTGKPKELLRQGQGPFAVYLGSQLQVSGQATRPLAAASVQVIHKGKEFAQIPAQVDKQHPTQFALTLSPEQVLAATYQIELVDVEQRSSKRPEFFSLRITEDRAPNVGAKLLGISSMITAQARLPIACVLTDDFAITSAGLLYRVKGANEAIDAQAEMLKLAFDDIQEELGQPKIVHEHVLEAKDLKVEVGQDLIFYVEAFDNDAIAQPKSGKSQRFTVRVVTEEELRNDILRREKEQRKQFEELVTTQSDLLTETRAIAAGLRNRSQMTTDDRANLLKVQKRQSQGVERCKMIAQWLSQYMLEEENNRVDSPERRVQKLRRVIEPLGKLVESSIPEATRLVDEARLASDADVRGRDQKLAAAVAAQERLVRDMEEILRNMVKSEGFQEAVNFLHRILDLQTGVTDATRQKINELFRGSDDKKKAK